MQFPTTSYFTLAKADIEQKIRALIGAPYTLRNVMVTTVGKSWASMYSPLLPHGDPGEVVSSAPATQFPLSVGPIYFKESVAPDPTLTARDAIPLRHCRPGYFPTASPATSVCSAGMGQRSMVHCCVAVG